MATFDKGDLVRVAGSRSSRITGRVIEVRRFSKQLVLDTPDGPRTYAMGSCRPAIADKGVRAAEGPTDDDIALYCRREAGAKRKDLARELGWTLSKLQAHLEKVSRARQDPATRQETFARIQAEDARLRKVG